MGLLAPTALHEVTSGQYYKGRSTSEQAIQIARWHRDRDVAIGSRWPLNRTRSAPPTTSKERCDACEGTSMLQKRPTGGPPKRATIPSQDKTDAAEAAIGRVLVQTTEDMPQLS